MKLNIKSALLFSALLFFIYNASAQFNDGPMELQIRVVEVKVDYHPTSNQSDDFNLSGSIGSIIGNFITVPSLETDEITAKVWVRDDPSSPWQRGTCDQGNLPMVSGGPETFTTDATPVVYNYPGTAVPQFFDLRLEAWEDEKPADFDALPSGVPFVLSNDCQTADGWSRCTFDGASTNCVTLFGAGVLAMEDDNHCDANPFQSGIDYRADGPPCQWNDHGWSTGVCPQNPYYQVRVESYYRFTAGTACNNSFDLGTLTPGGVLSHFNSNECYSNTLPGSHPGNDVYYKFHINNPIGIDINMCNSLTLFDTYIYLLDNNCAIIDSNNDGQSAGCGTKSLLSKSLCIPGDYYVVVDAKDANQLGTFKIFITENAQFTFAANITKTDPDCAGDANGTAEVTATPPNLSYTYLWNDNNTDTTRNSLAAGTYRITVTNPINSCTVADTVTLVDPAPVQVTVIPTDLTCSGSNDGEATAIVTGGDGLYVYGWNSIPPQNGPTAVLLPAGTFTVDVFDSKGCFGSASGTVRANNPIVITEDSLFQISCNGDNNGRIYLHVTGGVIPYSYAWSQNVSNDTIALGLSPGNYSFTVLDNTTSPQCSVTMSFDIIEPTKLVSSIAGIRNITCNGGNDGGVDLEVVGGKLPYNYLWSDGTTRGDLLGSVADTVSVVVTDSNGCITSSDTVLTEPSAINPVITALSDAGCSGNNGGAIDLEVSGGTPPYSYIWSPNDETTQDISSLVAGNYSVAITDDGTCVKVADITISETADLVVQQSVTNPSCIGKEDGSISLTPSGTGPFSFLWSNDSTSSSLSDLPPGSYAVTITDASPDSCSTVVAVTIANPTTNCEGGTYDVAVPNVFSPNDDDLNDYFDIFRSDDVSKVSVKIYDRWGAKIYENPDQQNGPGKGWDGTARGKESQLGAYVYVMEIEYATPNTTDRPTQKTGTVTVVR